MSKAMKSALGKKGLGGKKLTAQTTLSSKSVFRTKIKSGCASAAPPLGPLLGRFGLNISNFCKEFNAKTKLYKPGIPLPVTVKIKPNRTYDILIETPSITFYLYQAAGVIAPRLENEDKIGEITLKHIYEIAKIKYEDPESRHQVLELEEVVKEAVGLTKLIGLEIVKTIDPVEYKNFLDQRNELVEQFRKEMEEKEKLKLQRVN